MKRRPGVVLALLGACLLVVMMDNTILYVALADVQRALRATNAELQWAVDAYILVYAALMFTAGVLADSFGRRRVLLAGLLVFAVASALSAYAGTPEQLSTWRAVMGVGGAVVPPATLAIIRQVFPPEQQGRALGVWAAIGGLSVAFGPIVGGLLLTRFWWGSVFLVNVPVIAVLVILLRLLVPESRAERRPRIDWLGVVLSIGVIGAVVFGVIRGGQTGEWLRVDVIGSVVAGLLLTAVLLAVERRQEAPALDVSLFRSAAFTGGTVSNALGFFALTGGIFLVVFYVQLIRGQSPLELGLDLLPVAVGNVTAAAWSSRLMVARGQRFPVLAGLLLLAGALLGLSACDAGTGLWLLEVSLLAAGFGMGLVLGTATSLVMTSVPPEKSAAGAAISTSVRQVGAALGIAVMGSVYSINYRSELEPVVSAGRLPLPDEATESLGSTLIAVDEGLRQFPASAEAARVAQRFVVVARNVFISAMHTSLLVAFVIVLTGAALCMLWLPRRASSDRLVRRPTVTHGLVNRSSTNLQQSDS